MFYKYRLPKKIQQTDSIKFIATSILGETARFYGPHGSLCYAPGALLGFAAVVHGLATPGGELPVVSGDQPLGAAIQSANVGWSWLVGRGWLVKVINKNHWNLRPFCLFEGFESPFFCRCSSCVIVRSHSLTFSEVKRKHLKFERDWNLHPPRSWLSDDLGPGISVEAWKVAWLNCCMHIAHSYYHDL